LGTSKNFAEKKNEGKTDLEGKRPFRTIGGRPSSLLVIGGTRNILQGTQDGMLKGYADEHKIPKKKKKK